MVSDNPVILEQFRFYVAAQADGVDVPAEVGEYEAAALEWFLIGLVELKPEGVICQG